MPEGLWRGVRFVVVLAGADVAALFLGSTWAGATCGVDAYECPEAVVIPGLLMGLTSLVVVLRSVARGIDGSARRRPARHLMNPQPGPPGKPPGEPPGRRAHGGSADRPDGSS